MTSKSVKIYIDCYEIIEKDIKEAGNITTDGYEILGKLLKGERKSATVSKALRGLCCLAPHGKVDTVFSKSVNFICFFFPSVSFNLLVSLKVWKVTLRKRATEII